MIGENIWVSYCSGTKTLVICWSSYIDFTVLKIQWYSIFVNVLIFVRLLFSSDTTISFKINSIWNEFHHQWWKTSTMFKKLVCLMPHDIDFRLSSVTGTAPISSGSFFLKCYLINLLFVNNFVESKIKQSKTVK